MKKIYTIVRRMITTDPDRMDEQRTDQWNVMYESLAEANKCLVQEADKAFNTIKHRKNAYKTIATAGKSKVAMVGYKKSGYFYDIGFSIDSFEFKHKEEP